MDPRVIYMTLLLIPRSSRNTGIVLIDFRYVLVRSVFSVARSFLMSVLELFRGIQALLFHPSNTVIFFIFIYCPCLFLMCLWAAESPCDERWLQIQDTKKSFGMWERNGFSRSFWLCMLKGENCVSPGCRCFDPVRLTFVRSQCCCLMHLPYRTGSAGSNTNLCCLLG